MTRSINEVDVHAHMTILVQEYGSIDSVAALIRNCKGTVSKKMSGQIPWSFMDVIRLEDGLRSYPLTSLSAQEVDQGHRQSQDLIVAAGKVAKEGGEAVEATLRAAQTQDPIDIATARREAAESREANAAVETALSALASNIVSFQGAAE